jgi:hypothetical protein
VYAHNPYNGVVYNDIILATGVFSSKELWKLSKGNGELMPTATVQTATDDRHPFFSLNPSGLERPEHPADIDEQQQQQQLDGQQRQQHQARERQLVLLQQLRESAPVQRSHHHGHRGRLQ